MRHWTRRRSLQRRMFMWFGATIVVSAIVVVSVLEGLGGSPTGRRDFELVRSFGQNRFAEIWHDAPALRRLADRIASELDLSVRILDKMGTQLYQAGKACRGHRVDLDVKDQTGVLGTVELCRVHPPFKLFGRFFIALAAAVLVLWLSSVKIAGRLARPLRELARVAYDLGRGRLDRRFAVRRRDAEEVRILADSLNDMAVRIGKQLEDQRALLAAVSHELRSPLARMRVLIELLQSRAVGASELGQLDDEVKQVDQLVGDLLASARTDFSALAVRRLDAAQLALEAMETLQLDPTKLEVTASDAHLEGDATLLGRAILNLLTNAVRHAGGVRLLRVASEGDGDELRFEVEDDGPGIPVGEEEKIFEPFYRARSPEGARDTSSVGLGLSLVRRIAEAHGGRVFAERLPEKGSRIGFVVARRRPQT